MEEFSVLDNGRSKLLSTNPGDGFLQHSTDIYCENLRSRGLTCDPRSLERLKVLDDQADEGYQERILRCTVCAGLYKYIFCRIWQERNFDCERGWQVTCDRYFKVEERFVNSIPFPVEEAWKYGYESPPMGPGSYGDTRCSVEPARGLTCPPDQLVALGYFTAHDINKCRVCGEFYKRVWQNSVGFHYFKPGEVSDVGVPLPTEFARRYGYRGSGERK